MKIVFLLFFFFFTAMQLSKLIEATTPSPSFKPSKAPTTTPTAIPTLDPTTNPTAPTHAPTARQTNPSFVPTRRPSSPTFLPTTSPSTPTVNPTAYPSRGPTTFTRSPTAVPTGPATSPIVGTLVEFGYTGGVQTFTVPARVAQLEVTLVGACGADRFLNNAWRRGGNGAKITSIVPVRAGDVYHIVVGGAGVDKVPGFNGGGSPAAASNFRPTAGGGATDFRAYPYTIDERMMVAGGGGGASGNCDSSGGDGGYPNGMPAPASCSWIPATGGTQDSGGFGSGVSGTIGFDYQQGSFFYGGNGTSDGWGGAGGGGYYGGGGGHQIGGGGGSSYSAYPVLDATNGTWRGNGTAWIIYSIDPNLSWEPTVYPTLAPSLAPSVNPTAEPSISPSVHPSVDPSIAPSMNPTVGPTINPTLAPTSSPTTSPTLAPSVVPTADPTRAPSVDPTSGPTVHPSIAATSSPSADPTAHPTLTPTFRPSAVPTQQPTALPTVTPFQVVLGVQQDMYSISKDDYDNQKVQCNLTIQHTVASLMNGVIPERVTDIVVEEEEEEEGRVSNLRGLATAAHPVSLKYKVTVYDPVLSAEVLTAQLKAKVQSGDMNNAFRAFALQFNATKMQNGTFTEPQVTILYQDSDGDNSDPSNLGLIIGVTVGGFVFLCLLTLAVCAWRRNRKSVATVYVENN